MSEDEPARRHRGPGTARRAAARARTGRPAGPRGRGRARRAAAALARAAADLGAARGTDADGRRIPAATGGIRDAVAQSAERLYDAPRRAGSGLSCATLFLRLVMPGDDSGPVRTRVARSKLALDAAHERLIETPGGRPAAQQRRGRRPDRARGAGPRVAATARLARGGRRGAADLPAPLRDGRGLGRDGAARQRAVPRRPARRRRRLGRSERGRAHRRPSGTSSRRRAPGPSASCGPRARSNRRLRLSLAGIGGAPGRGPGGGLPRGPAAADARTARRPRPPTRPDWPTRAGSPPRRWPRPSRTWPCCSRWRASTATTPWPRGPRCTPCWRRTPGSSATPRRAPCRRSRPGPDDRAVAGGPRRLHDVRRHDARRQLRPPSEVPRRLLRSARTAGSWPTRPRARRENADPDPIRCVSWTLRRTRPRCRARAASPQGSWVDGALDFSADGSRLVAGLSAFDEGDRRRRAGLGRRPPGRPVRTIKVDGVRFRVALSPRG